MRGVKILAYVHLYPPTHNAGAEWMLHHTLKYLQSRGHEVAVCTSHQVMAQSFDGIPIQARANLRALHGRYQWADVVLTHLDVTRLAMSLALRHDRPLVHLVHNHRQLAANRVTLGQAQLVVFNSEWLRGVVDWPGPAMVLHPPVPPALYHAAGSHDRVLVSNLTAAKGVLLAYALAEALPEIPFLFVRGAYGHQVEPPALPNIEAVPHRPDFRTHLARARLVLMPSSYESWGRVAIEAACSGIPTLASLAPGLLEALGSQGIFLPVDADPDGAVLPTEHSVHTWTRAIRDLYRRQDGTAAAAAMRLMAYADRLWTETQAQLAELESRLGSP